MIKETSNLNIRISADLHRRIKSLAYARGMTLQEWLVSVIELALVCEKATIKGNMHESERRIT